MLPTIYAQFICAAKIQKQNVQQPEEEGGKIVVATNSLEQQLRLSLRLLALKYVALAIKGFQNLCSQKSLLFLFLLAKREASPRSARSNGKCKNSFPPCPGAGRSIDNVRSDIFA